MPFDRYDSTVRPNDRPSKVAKAYSKPRLSGDQVGHGEGHPFRLQRATGARIDRQVRLLFVLSNEARFKLPVEL